MFKNINIKTIIEILIFLVVAPIVKTFVSFVSQLFIIIIKNIYKYIFHNKYFIAYFDIVSISVKLLLLLICVPSCILVGLLKYSFKLPSWFGYKNKVYKGHYQTGIFYYKDNFGGLND